MFLENLYDKIGNVFVKLSELLLDVSYYFYTLSYKRREVERREHSVDLADIDHLIDHQMPEVDVCMECGKEAEHGSLWCEECVTGFTQPKKAAKPRKSKKVTKKVKAKK